MKIGARVLKTGLAITLAILCSHLLIPDVSGSLAAIGASLSTQPSVRKSFETLCYRIIANIIGGLFAVTILLTLNASPITIGLTCILAISLLNGLNLTNVIPLTVINIAVIMLGAGSNPIQYASLRVLETSIGVIVSFLVNWLIFPPKYDHHFFSVLESTTLEILILLRAALRKNTEYHRLKKDLLRAQDQLDQCQYYFDLLKQDWLFTAKQRVEMSRKLVVYRKMKETSQLALNLLQAVHRHSQAFDHFPDEMRHHFRERVETLMSGHEQIILKFYGKVGVETVNYLSIEAELREQYIHMFFEHTKSYEEFNPDGFIREGNSIIEILSSSINYEESLDQLNHLVRIYKQRYQQDEIDFHSPNSY